VLRTLELRDFAIVDDLSIELGSGLNVLSGETGAGKSLVIDALELLAGGRADTGTIRAGADTALVQGEFDEPGPASASRRLAASGRHTARIDGELVSVAELADRCGRHIAVFAQHGALELQAPAAQRAQLDRLLPPEALGALARHREAFERHTAMRHELDALAAAQRERLRRLETLTYQIDEIERVKPVIGEDDRLRGELDSLMNAERIVTGAAAAVAALTEAEPSATELVAEALRHLQQAGRHADALEQLSGDLADALTALTAVATEVESFLSSFEADPARLDAVHGRLAALDGLTRKYGPDLPAVAEFLERSRAERDALERLDHDAEVLSSGLATLQAELSDLAATLSEARRLAGATLSAKVGPLLRRLGMPHAAFTVSVTESAKHTAHGTDTVEFTFSANPGEAQAPISQIASGGELSRVMLALHLVTGTVQETVAFDEIDAGIGGKAAHDVGALLAALAKGRQVLVVTHLAQVAAFADHHYVVSKEVSSGRTVTSVRRLSDAERPPELARMLSGSVTTASLAHAAELLDAARSTAAHEAVHLVE